MPTSEYKARQMRAKTHEVYEYDHDETKPGRPLYLMVPGGLLAVAVLTLIVFIAYQTWIEENLAQSLGGILCLILSPFYVGGVFLFSYGYELYNIPRAIRLTAIIVFFTFAAVVIVAVLFLVLANMKGGSSSSSRSSSRNRSSSKSSSKSGNVLGSAIGGGMAAKQSSSSSSNSPSYRPSAGPVFIGGLGGNRVETREVTKEVVKEVPKEPMPITCPFCSRSYVPVEENFICPSCGAATPKDLIEESQLPDNNQGQ